MSIVESDGWRGKYEFTSINVCLTKKVKTELKEIWEMSDKKTLELAGYIVEDEAHLLYEGTEDKVWVVDYKDYPEHFHTHPTYRGIRDMSYAEQYSPPSGMDFRSAIRSDRYANRDHIACFKGVWVIRSEYVIDDLDLVEALTAYWHVVCMYFLAHAYYLPKRGKRHGTRRRGGRRMRRSRADREINAVMKYIHDVAFVNVSLLQVTDSLELQEAFNRELAWFGYKPMESYIQILEEFHGRCMMGIWFTEW
jgi:hypothetical protein